MDDLFQKRIKLIFYMFILFFSIKAILVPWSFFRASYFGFHDFGLISNFLANTAYGKLFFVDDNSLNHLSVHWTPTLILITPFFRIFESQYVMIFFGNLVCCAGVIYFISYTLKVIIKSLNSKLLISLLSLFLIFQFFANKYLNKNFISGHFEIFFIAFSIITLIMILENRKFYYILIPLFLALGVRQDMGLFLFFQILSLYFIPKKLNTINDNSKKLIPLYLLICVIYVFLSLKIFMPLMGAAKDLRATDFWSQWGNTWGEIIVSVLSQPVLVLETVAKSGAPAFNENFLYLGIFNPIQWLCVQIPGLLLFLANDTDKNHLFWYNSSMLLPGIYLATFFGLLNLLNFIIKKQPNSINIISGVIAIILFIFVIRMDRATNSPNYSYKTFENENNLENFNTVKKIIAQSCPYKTLITSADHQSIVFLPNSAKRYLLKNYSKSEIVIVSHLNPSDFGSEAGYQTFQKELKNIQEDKKFNLLYKDMHYSVFYNKERKVCRS